MSSVVALDFETYLISSEGPWPKPVCLSYKEDLYEPGIVTASGNGMYIMLLQFLENDYTILAQNMAFEFNVIYTHYPDLRELLIDAMKSGRMLCTKVFQELINHTSEKGLVRCSLDSLVMEYFGEDISAGKKGEDVWRLKYHELDNVPLSEWPSEAIEYSLSDSDWCYKVYCAQLKRAPKGLTDSLKESTSAEAFLNLMGKTGILVDQDRVATLESECMQVLTPLYNYLIKSGFAESAKNGKIKKKMKLFREYLEQTISDPILTAKGCVSTTGEALQTYHKASQDEVIEAFLKVADYEKIITAFVARIKTANPLIRCRYSATKSTGRTSSSTDSLMPSVNMQQMPREVKNVTYDVRNCFVPRPGYKMVSIDYAGLELSSTAHQLYKVYFKSKMRDKVNSGEEPVDMHSMFAYILRNMSGKYPKCDYDEFAKNKKKETYKEFRTLAKPINLGFPGGIGYDTMRYLMAKDGIRPEYRIIKESKNENELKYLIRPLRQEFDNIRIARLSKDTYAIVVDELVRLKKALFELYPELGKFLKDGHLRSLTGHKKWMKDDYGEWEEEEMYKYNIYGMQRDWSTYTAFCNGFLMQTPAAVGAKRAMVEIISKYHADARITPLAFIHDEIVFEVLDNPEKESIIEDISEIMIDQMQSVLTSVRITVEAEEMPYWMKSGGDWSKTYWKDPDDKRLRF